MNEQYLWNDEPTGPDVSVDCCKSHPLLVRIERRCLNLAARFALKSRDDPYICQLQGTILHNQGDDIKGMVVLFKTLNNQSIGDQVTAECCISVNEQVPCHHNNPYQEILSIIERSDQIVLHEWLRFHLSVTLQLDVAGYLIGASVVGEAVYPELSCVLQPVATVPIVPSALSKNVTSPYSLSTLRGQPRSGYLMIDKSRKFMLVLESDPQACTLPLVGVWLSGVDQVEDKRCWAVCCRYHGSKILQNRLKLQKMLLFLYPNGSRKPLVYQVKTTSHDVEIRNCTGTATVHFAGDPRNDVNEPYLLCLDQDHPIKMKGEAANYKVFSESLLISEDEAKPLICVKTPQIINAVDRTTFSDPSLILEAQSIMIGENKATAQKICKEKISSCQFPVLTSFQSITPKTYFSDPHPANEVVTSTSPHLMDVLDKNAQLTPAVSSQRAYASFSHSLSLEKGETPLELLKSNSLDVAQKSLLSGINSASYKEYAYPISHCNLQGDDHTGLMEIAEDIKQRNSDVLQQPDDIPKVSKVPQFVCNQRRDTETAFQVSPRCEQQSIVGISSSSNLLPLSRDEDGVNYTARENIDTKKYDACHNNKLSAHQSSVSLNSSQRFSHEPPISLVDISMMPGIPSSVLQFIIWLQAKIEAQAQQIAQLEKENLVLQSSQKCCIQCGCSSSDAVSSIAKNKLPSSVSLLSSTPENKVMSGVLAGTPYFQSPILSSTAAVSPQADRNNLFGQELKKSHYLAMLSQNNSSVKQPNHQERMQQNHQEKIPQTHPENIPQNHPESIPQNQPESIPQNHQESIPQNQPESIPQNHQESILQNYQESIPQNHQESIPQNHQESIPQKHQESISQNHQESIPQNHQERMQQNHQERMQQNHQERMQQNHQERMQQNHQQGMQPTRHQQGLQYFSQQGIQRRSQQSSQQGIQQSSQQGIQQSSQQGIRQSSQQGIQQSNQQGIQQSNQQGIQQSNQQGIQQSRQQGIQQSSQQKLQASDPGFPMKNCSQVNPENLCAAECELSVLPGIQQLTIGQSANGCLLLGVEDGLAEVDEKNEQILSWLGDVKTARKPTELAKVDCKSGFHPNKIDLEKVEENNKHAILSGQHQSKQLSVVCETSADQQCAQLPTENNSEAMSVRSENSHLEKLQLSPVSSHNYTTSTSGRNTIGIPEFRDSRIFSESGSVEDEYIQSVSFYTTQVRQEHSPSQLDDIAASETSQQFCGGNDALVLPHLNYLSLCLGNDTTVGSTMALNSLAVKYLRDEQLNLADFSLNAPNNMSLASNEYLLKHQLLSEQNYETKNKDVGANEQPRQLVKSGLDIERIRSLPKFL